MVNEGVSDGGTVYSVSESGTATTCQYGRLVTDPEAPDAADADADSRSSDGREQLLVDVDVR